MIAGAAGVALGCAGGWWAMRDRRPEDDPITDATRPWDLRGPDPADARLDALRHAILAPSAGNRQPWRARLEGDDGVLLFADPTRRLTATDPDDRRLTIGLGAFADFTVLAASQRGRRVAVTPFPEGAPAALLDARPVALLRFVHDGVAPDPLAAMIPHRRTDRAAFRATLNPAEDAEVDAFDRGGGVAVTTWREPARVAALRDLARRAWAIERALPAAAAETSPAPPAMTPAFLVVATAGDTPETRLAAGRAYARAALEAVRRGFDLEPVNAALNPDAAMHDTRARVSRLAAPAGATVQMLARLGRNPDPAPRAARRPLAAILF